MRIASTVKSSIKDLIEYITYVPVFLRSIRRSIPNRLDDGPRQTSRILIIELQILAPDTNAGDRNVLDFIRTLRADGHDITFWPMIPAYRQTDLQRLLDLGVEVILPAKRPPFPLWVRNHRTSYDSVMVCRPYVAERYLRAARTFKAPLIYYGHDLHSQRMEMQARVLEQPSLYKLASQMEDLERWIWEIADLSIYPSDEEVNYISSRYGIQNVQKVLIYSFNDFEHKTDRPSGDQIIFIGGFRHQPNVDAAKTLSKEIFPIIKQVRKSASLVIIGSHATDEIRNLESDSVSVRSNISSDELLQAYQASAVSLTPLRIGAGVKLKVVEALVLGVPVVTTSVGLQGLAGLEAIIGCYDNVNELAQAAIDILELDDARWLEMSAKCVGYAETEFSKANMSASLKSALDASQRTFETA